MRKKNEINQYWKESVHTQLSYWFCVMAVGIEFFLDFRYLNASFGQLCIVEGLFGLMGLLLLDPLHGKKKLYPKPFKKIDPNLFIRFVITFGVITANVNTESVFTYPNFSKHGFRVLR